VNKPKLLSGGGGDLYPFYFKVPFPNSPNDLFSILSFGKDFQAFFNFSDYP
jgi:hypothetical protein